MVGACFRNREWTASWCCALIIGRPREPRPERVQDEVTLPDEELVKSIQGIHVVLPDGSLLLGVKEVQGGQVPVEAGEEGPAPPGQVENV